MSDSRSPARIRAIPLLIAVALVLQGMVLRIPSAKATPGDLDPTFGEGGVAQTEFGDGWAGGVAIQSDGKIVVVGYMYPDPTLNFRQFAMVRYAADGSLDLEFGSDGVVLTPFGRKSYATDVALQPDGKIVVAGTVGPVMAVARYLADGTLDPDFGGGDGKATVQFGGADAYGDEVAVLADGSIVVAGSAQRINRSWMALARLTPQGDLEGSFGTAGRVRITIGDLWGQAFALTTDAAGIVVAGSIGPRMAAARLTIDGVLDTSFAEDGVGRYLRDSAPSTATSVALDQADNLVLGVHLGADYPGYLSVMRLTPDGLPDETFSDDGLADVGGLNWRGSVAIQPDGKIVVGGGRCCGGGTDITFAVARLEAGGEPDLTFGSSGSALIQSEWTTFTASGVTNIGLQDDGKIVLVGPRAYVNGFAVARVLAA